MKKEIFAIEVPNPAARTGVDADNIDDLPASIHTRVFVHGIEITQYVKSFKIETKQGDPEEHLTLKIRGAYNIYTSSDEDWPQEIECQPNAK